MKATVFKKRPCLGPMSELDTNSNKFKNVRPSEKSELTIINELQNGFGGVFQ